MTTSKKKAQALRVITDTVFRRELFELDQTVAHLEGMEKGAMTNAGLAGYTMAVDYLLKARRRVVEEFDEQPF